MPAQKKYDVETQARAVRMYADRMAEGDDISQRAARCEVGELLVIKEATLRNWTRRNLGENRRLYGRRKLWKTEPDGLCTWSSINRRACVFDVLTDVSPMS